MKLLNNKKGGEFNAGVWLVGIVIYFIFFILTTNGVSQLYAESGENITISSSNLDFSSFAGGNYCNNPRYAYNPETLEQYEYKTTQYDFLNCEESIGVKSESICSNINGCSWDNVTSGFWFWTTTEEASCIGNINASYYGIETTTEITGEVVKAHNNTATFGIVSICNHPNVIQNKTLCSTFGCTWDTLKIDNTYTSTSSVIDTVKDLFSFRYSFGFDDDTANNILNVIFFYIPLLMLIVSIYFMLPIVH